MSTKIFLDMDGVVADFTVGYCELHQLPDPFEADPGFRGDEAWDVVSKIGMSATGFWAPMGREFWANLPLTKDATEITTIIHTTIGMDRVCFLTTPCLTEGCLEGKRDWAAKHYPGVPILASVAAPGHHTGPKEFCAGRDSILIDDHTPNVLKWRKGGGVGVLVPRPWNRLYGMGEDHGYEGLRGVLESARQMDIYRGELRTGLGMPAVV